jgi:hypothetical protein
MNNMLGTQLKRPAQPGPAFLLLQDLERRAFDCSDALNLLAGPHETSAENGVNPEALMTV